MAAAGNATLTQPSSNRDGFAADQWTLGKFQRPARKSTPPSQHIRLERRCVFHGALSRSARANALACSSACSLTDMIC